MKPLTIERCDEETVAPQQAAGSRRQNTPPPPYRGGRGPRRFSFGYADLARFFGVGVGTARAWTCSGRFDPKDPLGSVARLLERRRRKTARSTHALR